MASEYWNETVETASSEKLWREVEKPALAAQLAYVAKHSAFYQNKWKGIKPSAEEAEFSKPPFTEKSELITDQEARPPFGTNLCVGQKELKRIHRTSGSTGRPLFLALTEEDILSITECGARCFWAAGLRP